jgi:hypothetical protein
MVAGPGAGMLEERAAVVASRFLDYIDGELTDPPPAVASPGFENGWHRSRSAFMDFGDESGGNLNQSPYSSVNVQLQQLMTSAHRLWKCLHIGSLWM